MQEIEDPELATKRTRMFYKLKGYSENWIEKRMRGIAIREELTDEWQKRGVKEQKEYEILTAEISKATFGVTPSEYKKLKGLKRQNLRDHMDDLEPYHPYWEMDETEKLPEKYVLDMMGMYRNSRENSQNNCHYGNWRWHLFSLCLIRLNDRTFFQPLGRLYDRNAAEVSQCKQMIVSSEDRRCFRGQCALQDAVIGRILRHAVNRILRFDDFRQRNDFGYDLPGCQRGKTKLGTG